MLKMEWYISQIERLKFYLNSEFKALIGLNSCFKGWMSKIDNNQFKIRVVSDDVQLTDRKMQCAKIIPSP